MLYLHYNPSLLHPRILEILQKYDPMITFQAYSTLYNDTGLFGILFTSFVPDMIPHIVNVLNEELESLFQNIGNDELKQHKKGLLPQITLPLIGTQPVADEVSDEWAEMGSYSVYLDRATFAHIWSSDSLSRD